jgi:hypothetical protein
MSKIFNLSIGKQVELEDCVVNGDEIDSLATTIREYSVTGYPIGNPITLGEFNSLNEDEYNKFVGGIDPIVNIPEDSNPAEYIDKDLDNKLDEPMLDSFMKSISNTTPKVLPSYLSLQDFGKYMLKNLKESKMLSSYKWQLQYTNLPHNEIIYKWVYYYNLYVIKLVGIINNILPKKLTGYLAYYTNDHQYNDVVLKGWPVTGKYITINKCNLKKNIKELDSKVKKHYESTYLKEYRKILRAWYFNGTLNVKEPLLD